ncbi:MAG: DUF4258 domain-containing protein [Rubrobacteraceae bacterium]
MSEPVDPQDVSKAMEAIKEKAAAGEYRLSLHAVQERIEDGISTEQLEQALSSGQILENYPEAERGACCLVGGSTSEGRPVHVVCTTTLETMVIITVYEPKLPWWETPARRSQRRR